VSEHWSCPSSPATYSQPYSTSARYHAGHMGQDRSPPFLPSPTLSKKRDLPTLPSFTRHSSNSRLRTRSTVPNRGDSLLSYGTKSLLPLDTLSHNWRIWNMRLVWLSLYFAFNLLLTLSNKSVLGDFPFPYTLTSLHALCSTIGGHYLQYRGYYVPKRLTLRNELLLAAFSVLYAVNIAVSNVSLHLVTVPFHQVVRATTPIFITLLSALLLGTRTSSRKLFTLLPVMFGVALATYGDYYFTPSGLLLTLLGTFLAALKTIYTNVLQSSKKRSSVSSEPPHAHTPRWKDSPNPFLCHLSWKENLLPSSIGLHPLDLLTRMSPLAFVQCVILAQLTGELNRVRQFSFVALQQFGSHSRLDLGAWNGTIDAPVNCDHPTNSGSHGTYHADGSLFLILLVNGCIAFGLNVVSFTANGKVGPLSMTVAANVKQVLTIVFAVSLFNLTITRLNAIGISITLAGGAWYAWVEYRTKRER